MKTASFARSFWLAFLPTAAVFLVWLHLIWQHDYRKLAPRVSPPVWGKTYVSLYDAGADHGNIDYYLFHTGILGFRQRINQADLLLFGTSHVLFGLSATQLSQKLSAAEGRPLKVFNMALVGSGLGMMSDVVKTNKIHDKPAIFDLFALDTPSSESAPDFMVGALSSQDLEAYVQIGKCWTEFWRDWLLDPLLPSLRIGTSFPHAKAVIRNRFLKFTAIRDWQNGDAVAMWIPTGPLFPENNGSSGSPIDNKIHMYGSMPNSAVGRHLQNNILQAQHIRPIYTLLPFDGSNLGTIPSDAQPFVPISSDGLLYWDGGHLTGAGRIVATEKLFQGMEKLGIRISPATTTQTPK